MESIERGIVMLDLAILITIIATLFVLLSVRLFVLLSLTQGLKSHTVMGRAISPARR
jgi:hypothetical protein